MRAMTVIVTLEIEQLHLQEKDGQIAHGHNPRKIEKSKKILTNLAIRREQVLTASDGIGWNRPVPIG
jgi:hypothetical protein